MKSLEGAESSLQNVKKVFFKDGFPLGEMTGDLAAKLRRNYFATKLYLILTWLTLARLLKTSKIRKLILRMLNRIGSKYEQINQVFLTFVVCLFH